MSKKSCLMYLSKQIDNEEILFFPLHTFQVPVLKPKLTKKLNNYKTKSIFKIMIGRRVKIKFKELLITFFCFAGIPLM